MHTRNPLSVLPEPVGAAMSVSWPAPMWGQPSACGRGGALGEPPPEPLRDGRVEPGQGGVRVSTDPRPQRELHRRGRHRPLFNLMGTTFIPVNRNRRQQTRT